MAFDGSEYLKAKPAQVYDKDNPPKRMSEAIRMAVADMIAVESLPNYKIAFPVHWHAPQRDGTCVVCLAGCVMSQTLKADASEHVWWDSERYSGKWPLIFQALNSVRQGYLPIAQRDWPQGFSREQQNFIGLTRYENDPAAFKRDMLALADRLEAEGS
ncbi:MAG: hypothetical protein AAF583_11170 [Pseudomonadota bacterium]